MQLKYKKKKKNIYITYMFCIFILQNVCIHKFIIFQLHLIFVNFNTKYKKKKKKSNKIY